jgi:nucleoside-diphosphate-sugar epimerase
MKVFVAGATGAIGKQLVPRLVAAGHEVHGMTRSESKRQLLHDLGAVPVVADALDAAQVAEAVARATPDVIVHQLTAIPETFDMRHPDRAFELTNRLRTDGTDHLLSAGQAVGVRRFVAQSNVAAYGRTGAPVKSEDDPVDAASAGVMQANIAAIAYLEESVVRATWTEVGNGGAVWSFIHIADAADATVAAIERGSRGIYNVVDDEPAAVAEWLPAVAAQIGAKKPMRVPRFVGRLFAGEFGVALMTEMRGASNAKAKRELEWRPAHPSWRQGLAAA